SNVWLKLENFQPTASVLIRGIGHRCTKAVRLEHAQHLVTSGDGNVGMAVAYSARQLEVPATVFLASRASDAVRQQLETNGATVVLVDGGWDVAEAQARSFADRDTHAVYIHAYDHPDVWRGHATLVTELREQMGDDRPPPAAVLTVVGAGGGLLNGVLEGMRQAEWNTVPVVAVETHGGNSLQLSLEAGRVAPVERVNTIATGLGARAITRKTLDWCSRHPVIPFAVSDAMAADGCRKFADDHRILVEATCGAGLSVVYTSVLREVMPNLPSDADLIVVVCGGSDISLAQLEEYGRRYSDPPIIVKSGEAIYMKFSEMSAAQSSARAAASSTNSSPGKESA
ncbi:tryptophan synthase beta subunit-like PLP-dependent enzyme, partial [Thamnocephalis sphaerospora]